MCARFVEGFGFIAPITLLPYINTLDPSATTVIGVTVSAGFVIGTYASGFTRARTAAVVPLAWAGDRSDERLVLLGSLGLGVIAYTPFPLVVRAPRSSRSGDRSPRTLSALRRPLGGLRSARGPLGAARVVDNLREPASMALFADEGTSEGRVASSFGLRELVLRPGSVIAPLLGGWLVTAVSIASVFYVGDAFAITGAMTFLVILDRSHGPDALTEW